jgi:aryl-alcohol dehydrogenase-like predicted oxidoreductase
MDAPPGNIICSPAYETAMAERRRRHPAPPVPSGLALGTAPLGGLFADVPPEAARATVDAAWAAGVRYFDTAPLYGSGLAERRLGDALAGRPRDEFIVSTKVGRLLKPGDPGPQFVGAPRLEPVFDFSHAGVRRSLAESLDRLGLDRVDIALVHDPDDHYDEALTGAFPALVRLREEGVVRAIGAGMNQTEMLCRFAREADPDCFLVAGRYTLLDRSAADELLPLCAERGISVIAGGVFNSGVLAGGTMYDYEAAPPDILARAAELGRVCERYGVPLAAAAVQFPLRHPVIDTVVVGCSTPDEIDEDVRLSQLELPAELWEELG